MQFFMDYIHVHFSGFNKVPVYLWNLKVSWNTLYNLTPLIQNGLVTVQINIRHAKLIGIDIHVPPSYFLKSFFTSCTPHSFVFVRYRSDATARGTAITFDKLYDCLIAISFHHVHSSVPRIILMSDDYRSLCV